MEAQANATDPGRGRRLRILFIPELEGGNTSERSPLVLRSMRAVHDVVGLRAPWDPILYNPRRAKWPRVLLYLLDKALLALRGFRLARRHGIDVVFCETAHHALAGLIVARLRGVRCIWDSHGNGELFYESLGRSPLAVLLIKTFEKFIGKRVDGLVTVSAVDARAYSGMGLPGSKIHVVPLSVDVARIDSSLDSSPRAVPKGSDGPPVLLFFGSFGYEPNREALRFVNDILAPQLELQGTRCEIRIAGRDIPEGKYHSFVHPIGFVPDIYSCIRSANVCIVPVRRGVGVLTKVIDAMAVGTPVVLSEFAARGIPEIRHGVHAYVATSDDEFRRYVTQALLNLEASRKMSRRARQLVEQRFDWGSYTGKLDAILRGSPENNAGGGR